MNPASLPLPCEAYKGKQPYAFVSYSHQDGALVYPEIRRLHEMGYRVWYDEGIDPGNEWPEEIANALDGCDFFLVFITPNSVSSKNVRNEINLALKHNKGFLAVHLVKTELPRGMELQMGSIQAILRYQVADEIYLKKLVRALPEALRGTEEPGRDVAAEAARLEAERQLQMARQEAERWQREAAEARRRQEQANQQSVSRPVSNHHWLPWAVGGTALAVCVLIVVIGVALMNEKAPSQAARPAAVPVSPAPTRTQAAAKPAVVSVATAAPRPKIAPPTEQVVALAQPAKVSADQPSAQDILTRSELEETFNQFMSAWRQLDYDNQEKLVAADFFYRDQSKTQTRSEYLENKKRLYRKYPWLIADASATRFQTNGNTGTVSFRLHFKSPTYESYGDQSMTFRKTGNRVEITSEVFRKDR
ncbi:MAG: hypothetical protein H6R18_736 [Proteobacteria bacterium]|nr:hypothetical protein [Pseudomonadota bacterium]